MDALSEAETRALDVRCRLPTSPASRTAVVRLRALPLASQALCLWNYALCDLPHLVRCAIEAVRHRARALHPSHTPAGTLFTQGISADTRGGEQGTPVLCLAAHCGSERALMVLLDGHANLALTDKQGVTAAHRAAAAGRTACLRQLLDAGASVVAGGYAGFTPLHLAAEKGHAECCSLLLAVGSDANARTANLGATPLMKAAMRKHASCVRVLLPAADLSITNMKGRTAFHVCVVIGNLECFELLLPLISDVDVRTVAGVQGAESPEPLYNETPLHLACSFGQERMVKALLHRGASRTSRDSLQCTPLHYAAQCGHLGCVRQLLGKPGAYKLTPDEVNAADVHGRTPLHYAAERGHTNLCGVLRAGGARLDAVSRSGFTPLMVAQCFQPSNTALIDFLAGRGPVHAPGTVCDECGRPEPEVLLSYCTGCLRARFCGSACAVAAWPAHRAECQRVKAAREERTRGTVTEV